MRIEGLIVLIIVVFSNPIVVYSNPYLVTQVVIETHGGAQVEWTNDPVHNGNESIRMFFKSSHGHAIIKVPYNQPFSTLESVYFTVKYTYARPRFALTLDKNDDGVAETLLLSDYSQTGNNQWTQMWGGSRWGWDETDYPMSTYGGPWQPLSNYVSMYPNVIVKEVGIMAEYWAFEPEGVSESLYVDGVTINGETFYFESEGAVQIQTPPMPEVSLSLQPEIISGPLYVSDSIEVLIVANLYVSNVVDLRRFGWKEEYDTEYLELWEVRVGSEVKQQTGGSTRSGTTCTLPKSFTGSGVLLQFSFKPKGETSSEFKLFDVSLYDSYDNLIVTGRSTCEIRSVSFQDWVDGEYDELTKEHVLLVTKYDELQSNFTKLQDTCLDLESRNEALESEKVELENQIGELSSNIEELTTQIEQLEGEISELQKRIPGSPIGSLIVALIGVLFILLRKKEKQVLRINA